MTPPSESEYLSILVRPSGPGIATGWVPVGAAENWDCVDSKDFDPFSYVVGDPGQTDTYRVPAVIAAGHRVVEIVVRAFAERLQVPGGEGETEGDLRVRAVVNGTTFAANAGDPGTALPSIGPVLAYGVFEMDMVPDYIEIGQRNRNFLNNIKVYQVWANLKVLKPGRVLAPRRR